MKKEFLHTQLIIDTKRHYPIQELFELMEANIGDRFGKIYTKKELKLVEKIFIEGKDGFVDITSYKWGLTGKGRVIIGLEKPFKLKFTSKDVLFWILCVITVGIAFIIRLIIDFLAGVFNLEGTKENRAMMRSVAEEIEKLVNK
jgi:hypothetical protein